MEAAMATGNGLQSVGHIVLLMLEDRSFDHMLGFLYTDQGNVSPSGQPYAGLTGSEPNPDSAGQHDAADALPASGSGAAYDRYIRAYARPAQC
jgi:phospholipase C